MHLKSIVHVFALFMLLSGAVHADPPALVGRISYLEGAVSFHGAGWSSENQSTDTQPNVATRPNNTDQPQWAPAQLNYPITTGDALWADANGRVEMEIGSTVIRADHESEITIAQLDDDITLLRVEQGVVNVHVSAEADEHVSVITPHGQVDLIKPGSYHLEVNHIEVNAEDANQRAPQVRITTLQGEAHMDTARAELEILPGESAVLDGDPVNVALIEGEATDFDDWALSRERHKQNRIATRYVSPEMTGYSDLDRAGEWADDPEYGNVWYPVVADDWAPYRYGHWAYIGPWGWTWIDDASWGFAPFHYGRWVYVHHAWGWCPGEHLARPVYAPALVTFVGGAHWGVANGSRPIGWVPLAPHEVYRPYYRASDNYVRKININHVDKNVIHNITINNVRENNFRNRNGVTVVNGETFRQGRPVFGKTLPVPREAAANVQPLQDINQVRPEHTGFDARTHPLPRARLPVPQSDPRVEMNRMNNDRAEHSHGFGNREFGSRTIPANVPARPNSDNRENVETHRASPVMPAQPPHSVGHPYEERRDNSLRPQQNPQPHSVPQNWQRAPTQPVVRPEPHQQHQSRPQPDNGHQQQQRDRS